MNRVFILITLLLGIASCKEDNSSGTWTETGENEKLYLGCVTYGIETLQEHAHTLTKPMAIMEHRIKEECRKDPRAFNREEDKCQREGINLFKSNNSLYPEIFYGRKNEEVSNEEFADYLRDECRKDLNAFKKLLKNK